MHVVRFSSLNFVKTIFNSLGLKIGMKKKKKTFFNSSGIKKKIFKKKKKLRTKNKPFKVYGQKEKIHAQ